MNLGAKGCQSAYMGETKGARSAPSVLRVCRLAFQYILYLFPARSWRKMDFRAERSVSLPSKQLILLCLPAGTTIVSQSSVENHCGLQAGRVHFASPCDERRPDSRTTLDTHSKVSSRGLPFRKQTTCLAAMHLRS